MSGAGHALIIGTSKTGKTTLAKQLAQARVAAGAECIVLDPFNGQWPTRYVYTDPQRFLEVARASTRCLLVVDESGRAIGRGKQARGMEWVTTQARHWGHQAVLLAQTPQQIDPTVRASAETAYVFRTGLAGARLLAEELASPGLIHAGSLAAFEYLLHVPCEPLRRQRLVMR